MLAFLFPGQGVQYPGMMADIAERYACAREVFDIASEICERNIFALCKDGGDALSLTENTQPCLAACELAALRALESYGVCADMYAGFSLGEWVCATAAGVISERDAFYLLKNRARFMQEAAPCGEGEIAVVLGRDADYVRTLCEDIGQIWPASFNCPGSTTVAGRTESMSRLAAIAEKEGFKLMRMTVSVPSHCPLMQSAADRLSPLMETRAFSAPSRPFAMNADGNLTPDGASVRRKLLIQLVSAMQFEKCIHTLLDAGADTFIEIGPGKTLSGFVRHIAPEALTLRVNDLASLQATLEALSSRP